MQQYIRELLKEEGLHQDSEDSDREQEKVKIGERQTKRGRPAIPDKWTRVISIRSDDLEKIRTFDIGSELLLD